jgi:hypothetical protein
MRIAPVRRARQYPEGMRRRQSRRLRPARKKKTGAARRS